MKTTWLLAILSIMLCLPPCSNAQTVSIVNISGNTSGMVLEAAMKRHLRAEGYAVKGGTTDGYVVITQVLPLGQQGREVDGVAGQVIIGNLEWQKMADLLVSSQCEEEHAFAQSVKAMLGTQMLLIESTIAVAPDEERLAELLSTFSNTQIRKAVSKATEFAGLVQKARQDQQRNVYSPMR